MLDMVSSTPRLMIIFGRVTQNISVSFFSYTAQKISFSFTEEILNGKLHFLCSVSIERN